MEKAKEFQKDIYFYFIDYTKPFDCIHHNKLWTALKNMDVLDHLNWRICKLTRKPQYEQSMKQLIGSKLRKEYAKIVTYCLLIYLIYKQKWEVLH